MVITIINIIIVIQISQNGAIIFIDDIISITTPTFFSIITNINSCMIPCIIVFLTVLDQTNLTFWRHLTYDGNLTILIYFIRNHFQNDCNPLKFNR